MSESKWREQEMRELLIMAAPIILIMANKGGSLFAHKWVERARKLNIIVEEDNEDSRNVE